MLLRQKSDDKEADLKRSMKSLAAVGAVVALMAMSAPAASAGETVGPGDAAGCTTDYVNAVGGPYILPNAPTVTYTPPAKVTVDADDAVNWTVAVGFHVANATVAYVICVA